jgi:hypothetical protein
MATSVSRQPATKQKCRQRYYKVSARMQFSFVGSSIETLGIHKVIPKVSQPDGCIGMDRKVLRRRCFMRLRHSIDRRRGREGPPMSQVLTLTDARTELSGMTWTRVPGVHLPRALMPGRICMAAYINCCNNNSCIYCRAV